MHPNEKRNQYYLRRYQFCCLSQSSEMNWGSREQVDTANCPAVSKNTCPFKIKLEIFKNRSSGYWHFNQATLCQKFLTNEAKEKKTRVKPRQIEKVEFPPVGVAYRPGEFRGSSLENASEEKVIRFLVIRKAWARNIAHTLNLSPGQKTEAEFEGERYSISIGPRWGVNVSLT